MRALWSGAALIGLLVAAGTVSAATELKGAEAPDFVLKSFSGKNLRLSEYRGEVVMLSFWATWCGDCRAQLTELGAMRDRYQDAGVELLAISLDQSSRQASEMTAGSTLPGPARRGGRGRPAVRRRRCLMVLIDRGGVVREVFEGFGAATRSSTEHVQALLRE
jgi:peroxiredoxin